MQCDTSTCSEATAIGLSVAYLLTTIVLHVPFPVLSDLGAIALLVRTAAV